MSEALDPREIATHFHLDGEFASAHPYGNGHINDTFLVNVESNTGPSQFIFQHINKQVFSDPVALMENVARVTKHLRSRDANCLTLIPTSDGQDFYKSPGNEYWRTYNFVTNAVTHQRARDTRQAKGAAAKFAEFHELLADLPGPRLNETIPDFHNTPVRYSHFHDAVRKNTCDRARHCREEIDQALAWEDEVGTLVALHDSGQIPDRIIHNDTKLDNLLVHEVSGKPVCVIDLDTVMPGTVLSDFGDMVRTATSPTQEDTTGLADVHLRLPYYEALVEGFVGANPGFLTETEIENLSISGKIITIETGLRFLTDYLCGDVYFRAQRPEHNLDRCRTQFALATSIEEKFDEMQSIVERVASSYGQPSRS